ncbi:hypothetical protein GF312_20705 [Candidatus Poribacteria bacterium]|nr:hypothetical protein [Candidatus Poribacteria bacterium]
MDYSDISITIAFFLGAIHAFWPGHGKALIAAYLIGIRGRVVDAIWLGLIVTATHIFSVIILGIIINFSYSAIMEAVVNPDPSNTEPVPVPGANLIKLIAGILILCVGIWIILRRKQILYHEHYRTDRNIDQGVYQMLLLGVSGGIIPCAEGIALLLLAIAAGEVARGLILVLSFSLGIAVVIVTIAIMICKLTTIAEKVLQKTGEWLDKLPLISGTVISALGFYSIIVALTNWLFNN